MTAAPSIPYWSGYWSVSSPGLQKNAYIDGDTYNLDMDYGWFNVTLINYSTGAGFSFFPDQTQNTDNATISGILTPENFGGGTTLGTFSFTANPNSSPDTVPDSFSGTYTLTGGQPIPISGTFEAPPNNPSLTSAVDEYGSTDPRARPINPTPPPPPPPPPPASPQISGLSEYVAPNFPNANFSGSLQETITGANFEPGATVSFGDIQASSVQRVNANTLQVNLSGFQNLSQGFRNVTVTNPDGGTASLTGSNGFYVSSLVLEPMQISQGVTVTGSQPAIAKHATVVRVKVDSNSTSAAMFNPLDIHLEVLYTPPGSNTAQSTLYTPDANSHAGKIPAYEVQTLAAVTSAPPTPLTQFYAQDSFNFTFTPAQLPAGSYSFRVEIDPVNPTAAVYGFGGANDNAHLLIETQSLAFKESTGLMNVAVMFDLPKKKNTPRFRNQVLAYFDFVRAAFPISADRVRVTTVPAVTSTQKSFFIVDRTLRELRSYYKKQLEERTKEHLTPYTSVVLFEDNPDIATDGDVGATDLNGYGLKSPSSIVSAIDPTNLAHELGHQFNLGDTYESSTAKPSSNNPRNPGAPLDGNLVDFGNYDFYTQTVSVPASPYPLLDLMGNGNDAGLRWIDNQTWNYLYPKFNSPASS